MIIEAHNLAELGQTLFEESGDAMFLFDPESEQILDVNPMAQRLTGFGLSALLRKPIHYLFRAESQGGLQRLRQAYRKTGLFHSQEGFLLRHHNEGVWVPVNLTVTRLHAEPETLALVTARDITERREAVAKLAAVAAERQRAEEAIRVNDARYRSLIENLDQCVFLKDADFHFVTVNPPFCQAVGLSEAEILGKTDFDFYPAELAAKFREDDRQVLQQGRRIDTEEQSILGGHRRDVRVVKTPVRDGGGRITGVLGIFWDVTEQRTLEAQLRQSQKMDAIGQLAGGVAHDFNNLLTVILGNLSLLATVPLENSSLEMLQSAETAALRAAHLTGQLLGFARRRILRPEPTSLNLLVTEVVSLLRRTIDPRITIETGQDSELWPVMGDASLLTQVLMNLCLNARDAMPEGGQLILQTGNVILGPAKALQTLGAYAGEFAFLRVRDTGVGMNQEVRSHVFEPFFTTKGPGKGTGLGLATVFGIVQQHLGWIECESEPGRGATFTVFLPRHVTTPSRAVEREAGRKGTAAVAGTETVLFVDDEPALRGLARTALERQGYTVLIAEDGVEALSVFRKRHSQIALVVLDLTMPRLSGRDTFRAMREINPRLRVLFASGYTSEQLSHEEREQIAGFIVKPYRPSELTRRVRESLDQSRSEGPNPMQATADFGSGI